VTVYETDMNFQERVDAEDQQDSRRGGRLYSEWSNGRRKRIRVENPVQAEADGHGIVLDLKDLTLVDEDAVIFLKCCEADGIALRNCPGYVREWITRRGS
jgi:hypothetical protein